MILRWMVVFCGITFSCSAVETRFWQQDEPGDFEKGRLNQLSLRSDGHLFLAPELRELFDSATPYLWAVVADSKGTLYVGGGGSGSHSAKLFAIDPTGKSRVVAELDGLEIHALAVDHKDRLFAATSPDGKVYQIGRDGKAQIFYDPRAKYIWAMAFDSKNNLYVATGDRGELHRVTPDGKGAVFFNTDETHARSLAIDAKDDAIVGTEPGGLVLRVSPSAQGFVLYQAPKREITALAVAPDGAIYAAGVGNKAGPRRLRRNPRPVSIRIPARHRRLPRPRLQRRLLGAPTSTGSTPMARRASSGARHRILSMRSVWTAKHARYSGQVTAARSTGWMGTSSVHC